MIELNDVSFRYGTEHTQNTAESLSHIDLQIHDGEFVLLTGPSGCGKTTILRLINGLIPHFYPGTVTGEVLVNGNSVTDRELYDTARTVGTVFQNPRTQFYNVDTTGELAFACENRGMPETEIFERIDSTVERFRIETLMDRNIFRLSDGEKQKIACASVDVSGTEIILLDEPSANLDHEATRNLRELIRLWQSQGKTIVAAEHRIAYLWDLVDRAVLLKNGRIIRQLNRREASVLTDADLAGAGLRTLKSEAADSIDLPTVTAEDTVITVEGLSYTYPGSDRQVVNYPHLELAEGKITAVTGANGIGKTSFLNCLCGLEKHAKGTLIFQGRSYDRKARQKLCFMVMQDTGNQLFTESVLDEVLISLPKDTENETERAAEILDTLDLGDFKDRHPQSLSGGQKQRLAIACAVASGRKILLLDEPTSGLDHAHMQETAELLRTLQKRGATILVVTHDSELIRECCDRKLLLKTN